MNAEKAQLEIDWADDTHTFRLTVSGILELEAKCDAPIGSIFQRMTEGSYKFHDIRETIRLGLIGGGMKDLDALKTVRLQIDNRLGEVGLDAHYPIARMILMGTMFGFIANPPLAPAGEGAEAESPSDSTPQTSTRKRADLDSDPATSTI